MSMFEVSKDGLAKLLERRGKHFVLLELIQNSFDEKGVTTVDVNLTPSDTRGYQVVQVADDAPEGFHDLSHAYTLFAESRKKVNPRQRGRWNLGEKLVIALCRSASITTTTGTVLFQDGGRHRRRMRTERGSIFQAEVRMSFPEANEAIAAARSVLVPEGIMLTVNGEAVDCRPPVGRDGSIFLMTEDADDGGVLRRRQRKTTLEVVVPREGEKPHLYELGIPVVELDCQWHVNIGQKVPLNMDRDNVTPAYLRSVLTAVVNVMHEELDRESASLPWVGEALSSSDIKPDAVRSIVEARHGENSVAFDPSDPEGSKIAVTKGFEVVHGGSYSGAQWKNIRGAGALLPAGQVTPSPKPFHPGGKPLKTLPREAWEEGHRDFIDYARKVAEELLGIRILVVFANDPGWGFGGAFGSDPREGGILTVSILARSHWFKRATAVDALIEVDRFLIHEFAHHTVGDHLSEAFHEECCRLGAKLAHGIRAGRI